MFAPLEPFVDACLLLAELWEVTGAYVLVCLLKAFEEFEVAVLDIEGIEGIEGIF